MLIAKLTLKKRLLNSRNFSSFGKRVLIETHELEAFMMADPEKVSILNASF